MTEPVITRLLESFRSGELPRDDYWKAIQQHHFLIEQYSNLIQGDLLDHVEIHPDGLQIVLSNGLRFVWNPHEIRTATSVLVNNGDYEEEERQTILALARRCTNIVDVGANIGWYAIQLADIVEPKGGVIHAFEPIPYTYDVLQRNISLNPQVTDVITTYNLALGETAETVEFYIPSFQGSVAASRRTLFDDDDNTIIKGEMVVLDDFAAANNITGIDMFKCDVEGAEIFVLRGGLNFINQNQPLIMLEMLRKWSAKFDYHPNNIIELLKNYGYSCWFYGDDRFQHLEAMDDSTEAVNFFFLHEAKHQTILNQWQAGISLAEWSESE